MLRNITGLFVAGLILTFLWVANPAEAYTWNSITNTRFIYYNYNYGYFEQMPPLTATKSAYSGNAASYTVKWGDSLWLISQKLGVSINSLRTVNSLWNDNLYPGEVLYYVKSTNQSSTGTTSQKAFTQSDIDLMARVVYAESRGEPYKGQVAVAAVIINRLNNPNFPKTVYEIVYQPWAFSSTIDGQIYLTPDSIAYKAVYDAINGYDPSYGALFFYNPALSTSTWIFTRQETVRIGNHIFAK
ncbi:cell wall hydrolase SleB [Desulfofarcimen acetoxidans DSM 771]|uniref:Cell wall hydrolase SleB n=1 Tax=Desulfofarcimen acetoxidans (strain ATCC 49208 / DSM 771 / KCTC 5769 / VKM B-1644 / 5575) TaxID=485916 RepID=C8VXS1_DESAS|nr:cell wall hydrolase [Desulfofarcimen acetoxidans]ACV62727.1 cell wall hydrolase SleB [Desulfofarcimen acetoxidans DSM 771]